MGHIFKTVFGHLLPLYFNGSRWPKTVLKMCAISRIKEAQLIHLFFTVDIVQDANIETTSDISLL